MCGCKFGDGAALYEYHGLPYCENDFRVMLEREDGIIISDEKTPETNRSLLGMPPTPSSVAKKTPFFGDSPRNAPLPPPPNTAKPKLPPPPLTPPPSFDESDLDTPVMEKPADRAPAAAKRPSRALKLTSLESKPSGSRLVPSAQPPAAGAAGAPAPRRDNATQAQARGNLPLPPPASELPPPPPAHHHPEHTPPTTSHTRRALQLNPPPRTAAQRVGTRSPEEDTPELDMKMHNRS